MAISSFANRSELQPALNAWCANASTAAEKWGMVRAWDVSRVEDLSYAFCSQHGADACSGNESQCHADCASFNADLNAWSVSRVSTLFCAFSGASRFNSALEGWNVSRVETFQYMYGDSDPDMPACDKAVQSASFASNPAWLRSVWGRAWSNYSCAPPSPPPWPPLLPVTVFPHTPPPPPPPPPLEPPPPPLVWIVVGATVLAAVLVALACRYRRSCASSWASPQSSSTPRTPPREMSTSLLCDARSLDGASSEAQLPPTAGAANTELGPPSACQPVASRPPETALPDASRLAGADFSKLELLTQLGARGDFATVWAARWHEHTLALKVFHSKHALDTSSRAGHMLSHEVSTLRRLRHPALVAVLGLAEVHHRPALVLEYMGGGSLAAFLFRRAEEAPHAAPSSLVRSATRRLSQGISQGISQGMRRPSPPSLPTQPPLPPLPPRSFEQQDAGAATSQLLGFGVQLASGLCYLHQNDVYHRDVKTDNALLDAAHVTCKLADFGLARGVPSEELTSKEARRSRAGTARYLAPETARERGAPLLLSPSAAYVEEADDRPNLEDRADVYAFGMLLYELVHWRRAFEERTGQEAREAARSAQRPPIELPPSLELLAVLIRHCWSNLPEDRPSMTDVLHSLENLVARVQAVSRMEAPVSAPRAAAPGTDEPPTVLSVDARPGAAAASTCLPGSAQPTGGSAGGSQPLPDEDEGGSSSVSPLMLDPDPSAALPRGVAWMEVEATYGDGD